VTAPYYEVLSETTDGVTTAYDYGVERISAAQRQRSRLQIHLNDE